jgi:alpha-1,2-glucosyltransferase
MSNSSTARSNPRRLPPSNSGTVSDRPKPRPETVGASRLWVGIVMWPLLRQRTAAFVAEPMMSIPFHSIRSQAELAWLAVVLAWITGLLLAWPGALIGDEWIHYRQIAGVRAGDFHVMAQWLTTLPGYHVIVGIVLWAFDAGSPGAARMVNAMFGLVAIAVFHAIRGRLHPSDRVRATAQFALLPILFPFFFLAYTDVLSLTLVLGAFLCTLKGRHLLSALLVVAAIGVRQNNVIWAVFLAAWAVWPHWALRKNGTGEAVKASVGEAWAYALPCLGFLGYWWWNGSVSYSVAQSTMHPDATLHAGNVCFTLFLVALLMPLQTLEGLQAFARRARQAPGWWFLPVLTFVFFAIFFDVDHPYNRLALGANLRNQWLVAVDAGQGAWILFGLLATASACALAAMPLVRSEGRLLWPFAYVFLAASWLIEPRYAFVPLALYLTLRKPSGTKSEAATLALWAVLAVHLAIGIFGSRFII